MLEREFDETPFTVIAFEGSEEQRERITKRSLAAMSLYDYDGPVDFKFLMVSTEEDSL